MSNTQSHMNAVKAQIARQAGAYPGSNAGRELTAWREQFDELRADLERLKFAEAHPVPMSSSRPLGL